MMAGKYGTMDFLEVQSNNNYYQPQEEIPNLGVSPCYFWYHLEVYCFMIYKIT